MYKMRSLAFLSLFIICPVTADAAELAPSGDIKIIAGFGVCGSKVDYCPASPAKLAINYNLITISDRVNIEFEATHISSFGDGELQGQGDRGTEFYWLQSVWSFK